MQCVDTTTDLSSEEALAVLEPYFEEVRGVYVAAGLTRCARVTLTIDSGLHDSARHFGACRDDGGAIFLAPELAELPEATVLAIAAHELGHATDFLYPGEFTLGSDEEPARRRQPDAVKSRHWHRWLRDWEKRDDDQVELVADAIAHRVLGVRYGYLGPCLIQTFGAAGGRPLGLR